MKSEARGKFLEHDYAITDKASGAQVVAVHQKWLSWGDIYELDIGDGVDPVLAMAVVLCFEILHEEENMQYASRESAGPS